MMSKSAETEVKAVLSSFGLTASTIQLGEVTIDGHITSKTFTEMEAALNRNNFSVILDKQLILAAKIENAVIEMIHFSEKLPVKHSRYLSSRLQMKYAYVAHFFSSVRKLTLDKFITIQKIELIKKMLLFNDLSISEIANRLHYNSANQLCAQFKRFTGMSPKLFRDSSKLLSS